MSPHPKPRPVPNQTSNQRANIRSLEAIPILKENALRVTRPFSEQLSWNSRAFSEQLSELNSRPRLHQPNSRSDSWNGLEAKVSAKILGAFSQIWGGSRARQKTQPGCVSISELRWVLFGKFFNELIQMRLEGFFPCLYFASFSALYYLFSLFSFALLCFLLFCFVFFCFPLNFLKSKQIAAIYRKDGECHANPSCTDPVRNFPNYRVMLLSLAQFTDHKGTNIRRLEDLPAIGNGGQKQGRKKRAPPDTSERKALDNFAGLWNPFRAVVVP